MQVFKLNVRCGREVKIKGHRREKKIMIKTEQGQGGLIKQSCTCGFDMSNAAGGGEGGLDYPFYQSLSSSCLWLD